MTVAEEKFSEREEIEMLLPWYATGRLDASDTARVAAYLERHPQMRSQLGLIREEQNATVAGNEAIRAPLPSAQTLIAKVATPADRARSWISRLVAATGEMLTSPTPQAVRWGAAAAAVIICLQAAALGTLLSRDGIGYSTASRPGVEQQLKPVAMIAFADDASAAAITQVLSEQRLRIVNGPQPGGFYAVRFDDEPSLAEQQRRLGALTVRKDLVKAVLLSK
jgi:anti-sigma factor RsiW